MPDTPSSPIRQKLRETWASEWLFVVGAALVILAFVQSIYRSWPTLDPLLTSAQIGVGLLLIVACERLRVLLVAAREIVESLTDRNQESSLEPKKGETGPETRMPL